MSKRFFIKTLGCKVNQYETELMRESLVKHGFRECLAEDIADIFIINTCTVTANADKESRHIAAILHKTNPQARIVITGCYVDDNEEKLSFLPGIWKVVKNADKTRIAQVLEPGGAEAGGGPEEASIGISDFKGHSKAFLKVQDGCDNFCSYCRVPYVRGRSRSRPLQEICAEYVRLVDAGFKEIVLTGICLGAWGEDIGRTGGLAEVLRAIAGTRGGRCRTRLSSLEFKYVTDELLTVFAEDPSICRHLHVPLQSGDDGILRAMNRVYRACDFADMVMKAKARIPGLAVTTDVLVGFPGETDAQFRNTMDTVRKITPSRTHIFTFSPRMGTAAYAMSGRIDGATMRKRYYDLSALAYSLSCLYRMKFAGTQLPVLVESKRDRLTGQLKGYTDNYIKVHFEGPDDIMKQVVPVKIDFINLMYTFGKYEPAAR